MLLANTDVGFKMITSMVGSLPDILKVGSIRESYASPCYGGGEAGSVIGAGGEADEVEPAQVVVQIAGGDATAGTQEVLQPAVAAVHRLHVQIAPNPVPPSSG